MLNKIIKKVGSETGKLHWFHWLVISLSLILTLSAWYISKTNIEEKNLYIFNRQTDQFITQLKERMEKYEEALWAGVAAIKSQSNGIDHAQWKRFSDTLKIDVRYPGINGIGVIYYVDPKDKEDFLANERKLRPDFKIKPFHSKQEFWPITYIEPVANNAAAVGLDMAFEENRHTAAKKSRDTGEAQITAPIVLVQDNAKTPGFLFYVPYYEGGEYDNIEERRENFTGLVYAPFIFRELMEGTLGEENREIGLKVSDGEDVLFDEHTDHYMDFDSDPLFSAQKIVNFYGRDWTIDVRAALSFRDSTKSSQPMMILIGGLLIDLLLIGLFVVLSRSNQRAVKLANKMTADVKESQAFSKLIMESNPDFIFVKDKDFKIVEANSAFINNYPEEERDKVIGYTTLEKYKKEEADEFLKMDVKAFEEGMSDVIEKISFPDGSKKILHTQKIRFSNQKGEKFILGVCRDVTEREEIIQKLMLSNRELDDFAYISSHDLKEPLRGISNYAKFLRKDYLDKLDESGVHNITRIEALCRHMEKLVSDLLSYSRIGRSEMVNKKVDLNEIVKEEAEALRIAHGDNVEIKIPNKLPTVKCDGQKVGELFRNLISNALKYNESKEKIVEIGFEEREGSEQIVFYVKDNGIGIDEKFHDDIFGIFKRLHARDEYGGGSGSGLTFAKKIVDRHNGKIWLKSTKGEGATFFFTLKKGE